MAEGGFSPEQGQAVMKTLRAEQAGKGLKTIVNVGGPAVEGARRFASETGLNEFLDSATNRLSLGERGRDAFQRGLADIGLAESMDDDGYTPRSTHGIDSQLIQEGARALLRVSSENADVTDEAADALIASLDSGVNTGIAGKDTIRNGLKNIGLASYLDDDK